PLPSSLGGAAVVARGAEPLAAGAPAPLGAGAASGALRCAGSLGAERAGSSVSVAVLLAGGAMTRFALAVRSLAFSSPTSSPPTLPPPTFSSLPLRSQALTPHKMP